MEGHSRRMKESQKERRCRNKKNKKEDQDLLQMHIFKDRKAVGLQWAGICVDKEDCAQTMMEWRSTTRIGVLFSRWQRK